MDKTYKLLDGREAEATNRQILGFFNLGDKLKSHFENGDRLQVVGFTEDNQIIVSIHNISFKSYDPETLASQYEHKNISKEFRLKNGHKVKSQEKQRLGDYLIGDALRILDTEHFINPEVAKAQHIEIVGFVDNQVILDFDGQYIAYDWQHLDKNFQKI